ncbi:MAG: nucleotidyltransferase domain-containing protein [Chloroflexota bacterium]
MKENSSLLLEETTHRLVEAFEPEAIILFGSHAWGEPTEQSDLDLLVIVSDSDLSPVQRAVRAHRCLQDLSVSKDILVRTLAEVDLFRDVRGSLEYQIFQSGKVLYEREAQARAELAS